MKHKLMTTIFALVLVAGFAASIASAKDGGPKGVRIKASFTLGFINMANPNALQNGGATQYYCGDLTLPRTVSANGAGYSSKLGPLSFFLQKTMGGPLAINMQGCATFKAPNGDALYADYAGNAGTGVGTLTFTGGTGRFEGATGSANFTGVFLLTGTGPLFAGTPFETPSIQGVASYLVEGRVYLAEEDEEDEEH